MPISWNEIRHNAVAFSKEWADVAREDAEAKSFWDEFFAVFGIRRRTVASFEEPVKNLSGNWAYIDLFWPGTLIVEHKSRGKSLKKAESQALEYVRALKDAGRDDEIPRYIIVSDFARIALHDLEENTSVEIELGELYHQVDKFAFIPGYRQHKLDAEDPVNIQAVELLGDLHDVLEAGGYSGHELERFLVRILFCLFAEDTALFERNAFTLYIENHTAPDGSDLGIHLGRLFQVLNTPSDRRQRNLLEELAELPYVNGDLFAEALSFAEFNRDMRNRLLSCCRFDWSRISPAVFGSLFQSVMEPKERRQIGAHYTSERDILKLVRSLFLDELRAEFEAVQGNKKKLQAFHDKLGRLTFFDPACGCGNFLVVTYRELRVLELEVLKKLHGRQKVVNVHDLSCVDVDAMYGIEISEFPARIAEVALWLVDHQMNQRLSEAFGLYFVRLPLQKSAKIVHDNALRIEWRDVLKPEQCSYVLGNPPFVGAKYQTAEQRGEMAQIAENVKNAGLLDYVTAWYLKAVDYIQGTNIRVAFVSTNSITQGEQVGVLWSELLRRGIHIGFAHRTFAWQSEARGKAHVHVVIIGFAAGEMDRKRIYDYETDEENPTVIPAKNISPYLVEGPDVVVVNRSKPLSNGKEIAFGNMPNDNGHLLMSSEERNAIIKNEPLAKKLIRRIYSAGDFIDGVPRWCIWLVDVEPSIYRRMPEVMMRINQVRKSRTASKRKTTQDLASQPALFGEIRQPKKRFLVIPKTSSERRKYIPMAFFEPDVIVSSELFTIEGATNYHFGVLTSSMHMAWVRQVCGRLKSDYRYSAKLVYNNYPWPESATDKQKTAVEAKAQAVLDARAAFPDSSLGDLYDPLTMPAKLVKAHTQLDRAVELCYRAKPFATDRERVEFLFGLYEKLTSPLTAALKKPKRGR
ncbi:MAG: class I SAM-dependent DNA methyltransferase [Planctomycetia bacterium]|nr:class I SAM-dependent DNA methyltransferase [Planctomycetia bacterium]